MILFAPSYILMLQRCFQLSLPLLLSLLLLCVCTGSSHGRTISLHPATQQCPVNAVTIVTEEEDETNSSLPSCMSLDEALEVLESDDRLLLSPGLYTLSNFSTEVVREVSNVTILGNPTDPESVIVTCSEGVGMFFFNASKLTISGLTVQHCGIRGVDRIDEIVNMTREIVDLVHSPLPDFSAAMFLVHCPDLELSDVIIHDNRGFGLVGINLIGNTTFSRVLVTQNYPSQCVLDLNQYSRVGGSGGGMFLVYQNYVGVWNRQFRRTSTELHFTDSNVTDNFVCRLNLFHVLHDKLPRSIRTPQSLNLSLIGAGGITLSMAQSIFQANVFFESCIFRNNSGTYNGAAMHISQFELSNNSHVFIEDSTFEENGQEFITRYGELGVGPVGALNIWYYTPNPSDYNNIRLARRLLSQMPSSVVISRSSFFRNVARSGAGVCVISFGPEVGVIQDLLVLNDTVFQFNEADFGGAIYLSELSYSGFQVGLGVHLNNINVSRNFMRNNSGGKSLQLDSGIVDVNFLNITITGDSYFGYNNNTAVSLYSAIVTISGEVLMEFNVGFTGGAVDLVSESYLVLTGFTNVTFYRNTALIAGGAIHVNFDSTRFNSYDCFAFYGDPDFFCNLFNRCNYELVYANFVDNSAPLGSTIYGSTFTNCPWAYGTFDSSIRPRDNIIEILLSLEPFITINPNITDGVPNILNTLPRTIAPKEEGLEFTIMPGKMFEADLGAFDQLDQSVPLTVFSQLRGEYSGRSEASIGATNRYLIDGQNGNFTTVPVQVSGAEDSTCTLVITSNDAQVEFSFTVTLANCSLGFVYSNESQSCRCLIQDVIDGVSCENDGSVTFEKGPWIGHIKECGFATYSCILNYCFDNVTRIFLDDPDSQCRNNRAGIVCGRCREGYSRILGSSSCRQCSNNNLALIVLFAILGILLVVMISVFNITITDGYINGMIFYCNIISVYLNVSILPPRIVNAKASQFFIHLINLNFGIDACFYDGMTDLQLAVLSLLFPLYLGMILLVITVVSKYCHNRHFAKLLSKLNITHVFATLLLLTYTSIIRTCIDILSYIKITVPDGTLRLWRVDPNQVYLEGLHIFEFVVALFLTIVLLPFPLLLLSPRKTLRLPYVSRLKPLIDAFVAPLADGRRFWVGFRILSRNFFFMLILLEEQPRNITICTFIILMTVFGAYIKPFRTPCRNLIDTLVMVNLTIFSFLVAVIQAGPIAPAAINIAFFLLVFIASVFAILVLFYMIKALPCTNRIWKKVNSYFEENIKPRLLWFKSSDDENVSVQVQRRKKSSYDFTEDVTHSSFTVGIPEGGRDRDFHTTEFVAYRESIFENSFQVIDTQ